MNRRHLGYLSLAGTLAASLACGASGEDATDDGSDPSSGTYLRGPFTTAPGDTALPPVVSPFPAANTMYFAWSHANLPVDEQLTFSLVAVDVGAAAAPNTPVTSAQFVAPEAGPHHGPTEFSLPTPWPAGTYRATATGSTLGVFGTVDFRVE